MNIIKAKWLAEVPVPRQDCSVALYQTETGWVFGLDANYVENQDGVLSDDELHGLGYPEETGDLVFAIFSPIDKDTIIVCEE